MTTGVTQYGLFMGVRQLLLAVWLVALLLSLTLAFATGRHPAARHTTCRRCGHHALGGLGIVGSLPAAASHATPAS